MILAGLLFTVSRAALNRAQSSACAENLHQLGLAVHLYANDNDEWGPPATTEEARYLTMISPPPPPKAEVLASPDVLRSALAPFVKSEDVWFCPADPWKHTHMLWLGQRHFRTSYFFFPNESGRQSLWPPMMHVFREVTPEHPNTPLFCDAVGIPSRDSDPKFRNDENAHSNHPDDMVNGVRTDLSAYRLSARQMEGLDK